MDESVVTEDDSHLRKVLWQMPSGLYVLSLAAGSRVHLMTISLVMQVAKEPRMLAMAVEAGAHAMDFIKVDASVGLVLLEPDQVALARKFAKPPEVDMSRLEASQIPIVRDAVSGLIMPAAAPGMVVGTVRGMMDLGSHWLITASVDNMVLRKPLGEWSRILSMADTRMRYGG